VIFKVDRAQVFLDSEKIFTTILEKVFSYVNQLFCSKNAKNDHSER
jgi:hypothetical protein